MRTIAIINQKGGVGKTTTTTNVGAALAAKGQRVLLIDLDPQAHLTINFGLEPDDDRDGIYGVLTDGTPLEQELVEVRENIALVPSNIDLAAAELELVSVVGREVILRDAVRTVADRFDYLLVDCPPSLGVLTVNALTAVDEVFIPLQPHFLALQGLGKLMNDTIRLVTKRIHPGLRVSGVILTMFEGGTRLAGEIVDDVRTFFDAARGTDCPWSDTIVFQTMIRRNIKLAEAPSHGKTIFEYEPRCHGAEDYAALADEMLAMMNVTAASESVPNVAPPIAVARAGRPVKSASKHEAATDDRGQRARATPSRTATIETIASEAASSERETRDAGDESNLKLRESRSSASKARVDLANSA